MDDLTIKHTEEASPASCPRCGQTPLWKKGLQIWQDRDVICRDCAKKTAPHLVALVDLASVAERVGRHSRHLLTPPMEAMLELARAAENYSNLPPPSRTRAG